MQVTFHRYILAEMNTHRVLARNYSSSRAIPVKKLLEQVRTNPAMPIHFGKNQPGMQADVQLEGSELELAKAMWLIAARNAADLAEEMGLLGVHKQVVNRVLEPYLYVTGIITSTEWDNFFELRAHKDAQPEIQMLAVRMLAAMGESTPKLLLPQQWHLPYVTHDDLAAIEGLVCGPFGFANADRVIELAKKVSAARCCRVSYLTHDNKAPSIEADLLLCDRLAGARPIHASPFEHQATPDTTSRHPAFDWANSALHGNFVGWIQHRKLIEAQFNS